MTGDLIYDSFDTIDGQIVDKQTGEIIDSTAEDINNLFVHTDSPDVDDVDESMITPTLILNMDEINENARLQAQQITEQLSEYYFDQRYVDEHPYINNKIMQCIEAIRRLLKMLTVNERAQDALLANITCNGAKSSLYGSLTSLQNTSLSIQTQLNVNTKAIEDIFKEMQAECDKTFEEKDKEVAEDGSMQVRGSREFIKQLAARLNDKENNLENINISAI